MSNFLPSVTFPNFHHKSFLKRAIYGEEGIMEGGEGQWRSRNVT
jgi:hypothetical protein